MARWYPEPEQWVRLAALIRQRGIAGWDSETEGHDPRETSPHGRARVVFWSLAVLTGTFHPRGYHRASGCTLPAAAMHHPALRSVLEDPDIIKVAHNAGYDEHSARNAGIRPRGVVNTLSLSRVVLPGRQKHGLKALMVDCLGRRPMGSFKELFTRTVHDVRTVSRKRSEKVCSCGVPKCRKRTGHVRTNREWIDTWEEPVPRQELTPLSEIVPGHSLFDTMVQYAAEDAEAALEIHDWLLRQPNPGPRELPW